MPCLYFYFGVHYSYNIIYIGSYKNKAVVHRRLYSSSWMYQHDHDIAFISHECPFEADIYTHRRGKKHLFIKKKILIGNEKNF